MSEQEAVATEAPADPSVGSVRFLGDDKVYLRLLVRGALLLLCTLGIYRFWLATDVRQFLWGNTEIAGNNLEYTGTASELLFGFLIAIAILLPVYALFFLATIDIVGGGAALLAVLILALLSQFAIYRARRYRLSRTVYRGVRFYQTGSAWRYAFVALLWWTLVLLTLGLAYPPARASLERFKMRHTFFGNLQGDFEGSALSLFLRGLPIWLLVVGPFVAGMAAAIDAIDWTALAEAVREGSSGLDKRIENSNPGYGYAVTLVISAFIWAGIAAALVYPAFQTIVLRWWISGLRVGPVLVSSRLRMADIYGAYFSFLVRGLIFAAAFAIVGAAMLGALELAKQSVHSAEFDEIATAGTLLFGYVVLALGYSTLFQATVKFSLWGYGMESARLSGVAALEHVQAGGRPASAIGEGLADALHMGGI